MRAAAFYWMVPFDELSLFMRLCMSGAVTPDLFIADEMNVPMAVESPEVPALDCIIPLIIPPMPDMEMAFPPIFPFMTPSEASQQQRR